MIRVLKLGIHWRRRAGREHLRRLKPLRYQCRASATSATPVTTMLQASC
nr:MAG TPA: hypothetical protein [Caudoviricetes sp.]